MLNKFGRPEWSGPAPMSIDKLREHVVRLGDHWKHTAMADHLDGVIHLATYLLLELRPSRWESANAIVRGWVEEGRRTEPNTPAGASHARSVADQSAVG